MSIGCKNWGKRWKYGHCAGLDSKMLGGSCLDFFLLGRLAGYDYILCLCFLRNEVDVEAQFGR